MKLKMVIMMMMMMFDDITLLGSVLAAFVLLSTTKIGADLMSNDYLGFEEGIGVVALGAILSATMLFWQF